MALRIATARAPVAYMRSFAISKSRCHLSSVSVDAVHDGLLQLQSDITTGLVKHGFYSTIFESLSRESIREMRSQAIKLREEGRFEPSWSESIDPTTGIATRFDKEGVFACEPDGADYDTAPDLLRYMTAMIQYLPPLLNESYNKISTDNGNDIPSLELSNGAFNAKLAVTSPGGSTYPLHVDNAQGLLANDVRKLTVILYLNPDYNKSKDGGELQLFLTDGDVLNLHPEGGRLVLFWSDEIPHQVLPTAPLEDVHDESFDRYALTIWLPTDNLRNIHDSNSLFKSLRERVF
jgi:hypothetical protein